MSMKILHTPVTGATLDLAVHPCFLRKAQRLQPRSSKAHRIEAKSGAKSAARSASKQHGGRKKQQDSLTFPEWQEQAQQSGVPDMEVHRSGATAVEVTPNSPSEASAEASLIAAPATPAAQKTVDLEAAPAAPAQQQPLNGSQAQTPPAAEQAPQARQPGRASKVMDIVVVSAEVAPWSKTGGLGDVVGSLPIALAQRGHRVMVVAPRYQHGTEQDRLYDAAKPLDVRVQLDLGSCGVQEAGFYHLHRDGVDFCFVDHVVYQRPGNPYADESGAFGDNVFRYALLSMAACEAPLQLPIGGFSSGNPPGFPYGENVLFLANDWHAGLVPSYVAGKYRRHGVYRDARCVIAIHNMSHQGVEPAGGFSTLGLPDDWWAPLSWKFPDWAAITGPAFNILKGGIVAADRVVTVSQGYAWEITTPEGGWGLHGVLQERSGKLNGITNGIDLVEWDPSKDEHIEMRYSAQDMAGKARCKAALQRELGFEPDASKLLVGWIGRLDHQKGPDVVLQAVPELARRQCQVQTTGQHPDLPLQTVMLGSGVAEYEQQMRSTEQEHQEWFRGWVGFSIPVAHRIIAGCDVLLMPSRFEPCGLNQLFAMRYGTVPIAHATGGLRDTIEDFNPFAPEGESVGTGWTFTPPEVGPMIGTLDLALSTYRDHPESWQKLQRCGMAQDLSWDHAAAQYEQLFEWALMDPPQRAG